MGQGSASSSQPVASVRTSICPPNKEVGVGVGLVALDEHVVPLGNQLVDRPRLHPAHLDVVKGDVEDTRILDQPVIGDHGDPLLHRALHRGQNRGSVLCQEDQGVGSLAYQVLHVGELLLG